MPPQVQIEVLDDAARSGMGYQALMRIDHTALKEVLQTEGGFTQISTHRRWAASPWI